VTATVFVLTATTSVLGLSFPSVLAALGRTPAGLHGDWWRSFTSLFVQDGGVAGTISNLAFLLVMGTLVEQFLSRGRWFACYFGAGLCGEIVAYAWQPTGAGNSVANCGLAGALIVALLASRRMPQPRIAPMVLLYWSGALLVSAWSYAWIVVAVGAAFGVQVSPNQRVAGRLAAGAALIGAAALTIATNIHGAALLAGTAIAAIVGGD
jgi:membrane associated rhomboid family serine protease